MKSKLKYSTKEEKLFKMAMSLKDAEKYDDAVRILKGLLLSKPEDPVFNGMTGGVYFLNKKYRSSLKYFRKTVMLIPKSELASLGYYHSLRNLGYIRAGINEINRFMKLKNCNDYRKIIIELYQKRINKTYRKYQKLIEQVYHNIFNQ